MTTAKQSVVIQIVNPPNGLISSILNKVCISLCREWESRASGYIKSFSCEITRQNFSEGEMTYPLPCTIDLTEENEENSGKKLSFRVVDSEGVTCATGHILIHFVYAL